MWRLGHRADSVPRTVVKILNRTLIMIKNCLLITLLMGLVFLASEMQAAPKRAASQAAVLALSWTPAFCEIARGKRECRSQKEGRYDTRNFALHGLWPQKQYCSHERYQNVPDKLWKAMKIVMPGTASGLHRHEWEKHGTCYADTPDRYFADAVRLTLAMNQTPISDLFRNNIGRNLSSGDIRTAFDEVFGRGAGDRVLVHCVKDGNRQLIQELRISLNGDLAGADFPVLLKQARPQKQGCRGGFVDAVGLQ